MANGDGILLHRLKALRNNLQIAALGEAHKKVEDACVTLATTAEIADTPQCLQCQREMKFSSVASYDADHDEQTFECATCQYSRAQIVRRVSRRQF
jgi:transposase-like protein